jgi:hypothetical protein
MPATVQKTSCRERGSCGGARLEVVTAPDAGLTLTMEVPG